MADLVSHPPHYTHGGTEAIDVIEAWELGFHIGNAVKYLARCGRKAGADPLEDLAKARWYIDREIARRKRGRRTPAPAARRAPRPSRARSGR